MRLLPFYFALLCVTAEAQRPRLILRADDMGITHATNAACMDVYQNGLVRAVNVIVPSPWFPEAVRMLNEHPGYDVGIHLAITSEWTNLKWRPLTCAPSLTDSNGYFYPTIWGDSPAFPSLNKQRPNLEELERECRAQIEMARRLIPRLSNIAPHMAFDQSNPEFSRVVQKLAKEYNLPVIEPPVVTHFPRTKEMGDYNRKKREKAFIHQLALLEKGKTYLFFMHPAYGNAEMESIFTPEYFGVGIDRQADTQLMKSKKVRNALKKYDIEVVSVKDCIR
jgi:chitin disaccharide deacetylase